jgi:hypothetical protein
VLDRNLSHVASKLAEGVRVVTSWPVAAVRYAQTDGDSKRQWSGGGGCEVRGKDGRVVRCERVVVAVPLNVLKAEDIEFAPPLPEPVRRALGAMAMGNAVKVRAVALTAYVSPPWVRRWSCHAAAGGRPRAGKSGWACGHARQPYTPPGGSWAWLRAGSFIHCVPVSMSQLTPAACIMVLV